MHYKWPRRYLIVAVAAALQPRAPAWPDLWVVLVVILLLLLTRNACMKVSGGAFSIRRVLHSFHLINFWRFPQDYQYWTLTGSAPE